MLLNVVEIEKYYGTRNNLKKALDRVSFSVNSGDFVSIMGASGSGKTTLLNCISTIDSVSSGHIYLGEQDLTTISSAKMAAFRRENLGFIFQDFNLLEPLTIEENISLPLSIKGIPGKEIEKIVKRLMQRLNISDIAGKLPAHVSGGQKQRCACARAFVNNPKLILADLNHIDKNVLILSKTGVRNQSASMAVYTVLPLFYFAFVSAAIACTLLSVQILSWANKERKDYLTLDYIGVANHQKKTLLKKQLFLLYFVPVVPATLVNLLLFPVMTGSIVNDVNGVLQIASIISGIQQTVLTVCLLLVVYFFYYVATYMIYKRTIIPKK